MFWTILADKKSLLSIHKRAQNNCTIWEATTATIASKEWLDKTVTKWHFILAKKLLKLQIQGCAFASVVNLVNDCYIFIRRY